MSKIHVQIGNRSMRFWIVAVWCAICAICVQARIDPQAEKGDAVFRDLYKAGINVGHTAIYYAYYAYTADNQYIHTVIQASGTGGDTPYAVAFRPFDYESYPPTFMSGLAASSYWGAGNRSTLSPATWNGSANSMTAARRDSIITEAQYLLGTAYCWYWGIWEDSNGNDGTVSCEPRSASPTYPSYIRCDGVVQWVYERVGFNMGDRYTSIFDASPYPRDRAGRFYVAYVDTPSSILKDNGTNCTITTTDNSSNPTFVEINFPNGINNGVYYSPLTVNKVNFGTTSYRGADLAGHTESWKSFTYWQVTGISGSGGSISPSGSFAKNNGVSQTFTASPNANYVVNQWLVDGSVVQNGSNSYTLSNITTGRNVQVTFSNNSPPVLSYVAISGATEVNEFGGAQYTCMAYYSDGNSVDVSSSSAWSENSSYASINTSGYLSTTAVSSDQACRITATYSGKSDTHDITIKNVNAAPTDILLSNSSVPENQQAGSLVGILSATDPDAGNTFTYTLASGIGGADNGSFSINGNSLLTAAVFDYEAKTNYSIRVRSTDQGGLWFEKAFTIAVSNLNDFYKLTVTSVCGGSVPAGTNSYHLSTVVSVAVTNSPFQSGTTQFVCSGWAGTGSAPAIGATTNTGSFAITNDSSIVWSWRTNYWLHVDTTGSGSVSTSDVWIASGTNIQVTATPGSYYIFGNWQGQTNGCTLAGNKITVVMNAARGIGAVFIADMATNAVPKWWLAQYGLTNFNTDALSDVDSDGLKTWQEYIAGTDPTNPVSSFRVTENSRNVVGWNAVSGRVYSVYWTTNLMSGFQCLESNIPWTRGGFTNSTTVPRGYYKIDVRLAD